jgi:predicted RNase H-like HicB family nuclease
MEYIAYLHKDKGSDFGVSFPDVPGCVTAGRTLEEARQLAGEALTLHIAGMLEDGEALPKPSTLDELASDRNMRGAVAFLVSAEAPEKTIRVNITARESQIEAIDRLARERGMTRSAYMVQSATRVVDGAITYKRTKLISSDGPNSRKRRAGHSASYH